MGIMKKLLTGLTIIVLAAILLLGYFGFVPVVSNIMGANTPRDLGVRATAAHLASANAKLGVTFTVLPSTAEGKASLSETGTQPVNVQLTSEEVTALVNDHSEKWKYYPIDHVQVKINTDNTIELSGVLRVDRWKGYADATGLPESGRSQIRPYLSVFTSNPAIYMKGTLSIQNYPQLSVSEIDLGRLGVTQSQFNDYLYAVESFISHVDNLYQIHITQLKAEGGMLRVVGSEPTNVGLSPPQTRVTNFWVPSAESAISSIALVSLAMIIYNSISAPMRWLSEKLNSLIPEFIKKSIEDFLASKSEQTIELKKGSIFKLTKQEIFSYAVSLTVLTFAFSYSSSESIEEMLLMIPVVLTTSIVVEFTKNVLIAMIARTRGVWTEHRIWFYGIIMFLASTLVFKTPFSSPSRNVNNAENLNKRTVGLLASSSVLIGLVFAAIFYAFLILGVPYLGKIGLGMCLLMVLFDSMPIKAMNGGDIYEWSKAISILLLIITMSLNLYWLWLL
jgi:hypothetical protein